LFRSGASADWLSFASNAVFSPGTGDFTAEAFIYPTANRTYSPVFETQAVGASGTRTNGWVAWRDTNGAFNLFGAASGFALTTASGVLPLNTWKHVAICRASGILYVYIDAVEYLATSSHAIAQANMTNNAMIVGRLCDNPASSANNFAGNISNWRWIKGNAQYTQPGFTIPTADLSTTPVRKDWTRNYGIKILG
jgi:hypothetical protein